MTTRVPVMLGDVQETLLIPLYARALETRRERGLVRDDLAQQMVESIDYDFTRFDQPPTLLGSVLRTAIIDRWVGEFLAEDARCLGRRDDLASSSARSVHVGCAATVPSATRASG